jgi:hypothetical protein
MSLIYRGRGADIIGFYRQQYILIYLLGQGGLRVGKSEIILVRLVVMDNWTLTKDIRVDEMERIERVEI